MHCCSTNTTKFTQPLLQIKQICSASGCLDLKSKPSDLVIFFNSEKSLWCIRYNPACQTIPGLDIWDRSTCPWEWFSEVGPDSPGDKHVNMCHTSAAARFFCKHCRSPHGCHPITWRRTGVGGRDRRQKVNFDFWHLHLSHQRSLQHKLFLRGFQTVKAFELWDRKTRQNTRNMDICPLKAKCYSKHLSPQLLLATTTPLESFFFKSPPSLCLFFWFCLKWWTTHFLNPSHFWM